MELVTASTNQKTAVVIFAHGSSVDEANQTVHGLALEVQQTGQFPYVRAAFLEPFWPSLDAAFEEAIGAGFRRIVVVPYFLTPGLHMQRDLPALLEAQRKKHPQAEILAAASLDNHPLMASIIAGRAREAAEQPEAAR